MPVSATPEWPSLGDEEVFSGSTADYCGHLRAWLAGAGDGQASDADEEAGTIQDERAPRVAASVRDLNAALCSRGHSAAKSGKSAKSAAPAARNGSGDGDSGSDGPFEWVNAAPVISVADAAAESADGVLLLAEAAQWGQSLGDAIAWLGSGVSASSGAAPGGRCDLGSQGLVQHALAHAIGGVPPSPADIAKEPTAAAVLVDSARFGFAALAPGPRLTATADPLAPVRRFRPSLVVLLFHRHAAVRVWARERLLECVYETANLRASSARWGGPDGDGAVPGAAAAELRWRALWVLACRLLAALKHMCEQASAPLRQRGHQSGTPPPDHAPSNETVVQLAAEGFYHAFVVLTVLDQRLAAARAAVAVPPPAGVPHQAAVLLLGGSLLLRWLTRTLEELLQRLGSTAKAPSSSGRVEPTASSALLQRTAALLCTAVNDQLRHDRTLQPVALAADAKKSMVKVLVHSLLDSVKAPEEVRTEGAAHGGGRAHLLSTNEAVTRAELRERRMRYIWAIANAIDAPPQQQPQQRQTADIAAATAQCAGWMLEPLLKNAAAQLQLDRAIAKATTRPQQQQQIGAAAQRAGTVGGLAGMRPYVRPGQAAPPAQSAAAGNGSGGGSSDEAAAAVLEKAVRGYTMLLRTLLDAVPAFGSSALLHGALLAREQELFTIAAGAIVHRAFPEAVQLVHLFFTVDLLTFTAAGAQADPMMGLLLADQGGSASAPSACFRRFWGNYPKVLTQVLAQSPRPAATHFSGAGHQPHILVQMLAALRALVDDPLVARWVVFLPSLEKGPVPLKAEVRRLLDGVVETLRTKGGQMKRQWEEGAAGGGDPTAAVSRLLAGEATLPRLVHLLNFAGDGALRALAEGLSAVFLHAMSKPVRNTFVADAAQWLWTRAILPHPLLQSGGERWLRMRDPKVDGLARTWGPAWLQVMARCNWESEDVTEDAARTAAAWWMAALLADVGTLDDPARRHDLVERIITKLPQADAAAAPASGAGGGSDPRAAPPLYAVMRQLLVSLLRRREIYAPAPLVSAVLFVAGALPQQTVSGDTAFLKEVNKLLVAASGYLGLQEAVAAEGGRADSTASSTSPATALLRYGPPWLVQAAQQATSTVDASLADQERRLRQFEWEEKNLQREQEMEAHVSAQESQRMAAGEAQRAQQLRAAAAAAQEREAGGPRLRGLAALANPRLVTVQRREPEKQPESRPGTPPPPPSPPQQQQQQQPSHPMAAPWASAADSGSGGDLMQAEEQPVRRQKRADPFNDSPAVVSAAASASQVRRQTENEQRLRTMDYQRSEEELVARLYVIAASTELLSERVRTNDIIGTDSGCIAAELPVIPEIFASRGGRRGGGLGLGLGLTSSGGDGGQRYLVHAPAVDHVAGEAYARTFVPHIVLEMRHSVRREYEEFVDVAADAGHCGERSSNRGGRHDRVDRAENPGTRLANAFPMNRLVVDKAVTALFSPQVKLRSRPEGTGEHARINFGVTAHAVRNAMHRGTIASSFSSEDVVLVMLPLSVVLPAWWDHVEQQRRGGNDNVWPRTVEELIEAIPPSWRTLGCMPQVCYIDILSPGIGTSTLCTYPTHPSRTAFVNRRGSASLAPPIPFLHALQLGFGGGLADVLSSRGKANPVIYMTRIGTVRQWETSVHALFRVVRSRIAETLYDPRTTAKHSSDYMNQLTSFLRADGGEAAARVQARLLLGHALNEWQAMAVCAVLYATVPKWDSCAPVREDGSHAAAADIPLSYFDQPSARDDEAPRFVAGRVPEVLIIEGPPGTGKTQTIATLTLNALHHLPATGRVLLCAPSNCAVDEALLRVKRLQDALRGSGGCEQSSLALAELMRVGVRESVDQEILRQEPPIFLDDRVQWEVAGRGGSGTALREKLMSSAKVIFTTLGSLSHVQRCNLQFELVIVDEASQATEPDVLQALLLAKRRCVLVGDPNQLQPTILCSEAAEHGLKRSLLSRLLMNGHRSTMLRTQYRMHPDICFFPNRRYYGSKLRTDASVGRRQRLGPADLGGGGRRLTIGQQLQRAGAARFAFVDVPAGHTEKGRGMSSKCVAEAKAIVAYMRQLRTFLGLSVSEFAAAAGVITYYRAQHTAITLLLTGEERASGIQIATVDSFQGKEKDIILISCVRALERSRIGELESIAIRAAEMRVRAAGEGAAAASAVDVDAEDDEEGVRESPTRGTTGAQRAKKRRVDGSAHPPPRDDAAEAPAEMLNEAAALLRKCETTRPLGFITDRHRINVSLTRAKELCVVFGHAHSFAAVGEVEVALSELREAIYGARRGGDGAFPLPTQPEELLRRVDALPVGPVGSPTTVDSTKEAVMEKIRRDDDDQAALAALVLHAKQHSVRGDMSAEDRVAMERMHRHDTRHGSGEAIDDGDVVVVESAEEENEEEEEGATLRSTHAVRAAVITFPGDALMDKLSGK